VTAERCFVCPAEAQPSGVLCRACSQELVCRLMAAEPDPQFKKCFACEAPFKWTEARVIRHRKNAGAGNPITPYLCWVCARLHYSALQASATE
jgi:hypothetical protein